MTFFCSRCQLKAKFDLKGNPEVFKEKATSKTTSTASTTKHEEPPISKSQSYLKTNFFTDCELQFPPNLSCASTFNMIFKDGLSFAQFEEWHTKRITSVLQLQTPHFKYSKQFNLKKDIWGPKEILLIAKDGREYDLMICYGIRDPHEFTKVDNYLKSNKDYHLISDQQNNKTYRGILNRRYFYYDDSRQLSVFVERENSQHSRVSLFIHF